MGKHSELPVTERREAVLSLLRREETAIAIARRYGISEETTFDCPCCHTSVSNVETPSVVSF
jgi:hypothetical protein